MGKTTGKTRSGAAGARSSGHAVYAGVNTVSRKDTSTTIGGLYNFDTSNRFRYYQQLAGASPHVSTSLNKLGLSLVKGLKFKGSNSRLVKDFETWSRRVNFVEQAQTAARLLCRDGVYIANTVGQRPETFSLRPLLMSLTTVLPEGLSPGQNAKEILQPPVRQICINEGLSSQVLLNPTDVVYGTFNSYDAVQLDIRGRETFGIYGSSLLDPIELSIRNLLNINSGYVSFVKKYGMGRYLLDFQLLERLVEQGLLTYEEAQAAIDDFADKHKYLSENEDITSFGLQINPIDAKGSLDVQAFKESLETDIALGLLQSPLTMGKTAGSTYAAGYVAEEDRYLVLEGLQKIVENLINEVVNKRLALLKKPEGSITVSFDELSARSLSAGEVQEMYNTGVISRKQYLDWAGFMDDGSLSPGEPGETGGAGGPGSSPSSPGSSSQGGEV